MTIRAGKLDRSIRLQRDAETIDEFGRVANGWNTFHECRAELVEANLGEGLMPFGEAETSAVVFRLYYVPGVTTADRLECDGLSFNIRRVVEIGRRRGLEIHAERAS